MTHTMSGRDFHFTAVASVIYISTDGYASALAIHGHGGEPLRPADLANTAALELACHTYCEASGIDCDVEEDDL